MYRSPSKIKSYKSLSNMAAGHCSLLIGKTLITLNFGRWPILFFDLSCWSDMELALLWKLEKKTNSVFFTVAIYLRKMLIFHSIHYKNMYIYNIPRKNIICTVTYIFYFTSITLWYSGFSLQNISKKTMVKVNSRKHP